MKVRRPNPVEHLWIDLYAFPFFRGRLHRIYANELDDQTIFQGGDLPRFRSIIVSPRLTARFDLRGGARVVELSPRTIVPDTALRMNGGRVKSLHLASIRPAASLQAAGMVPAARIGADFHGKNAFQKFF